MIPSIRLVVFTDGRPYIGQALPTAIRHLLPSGLITERVIHDDSGDPDHTAHLRRRFPYMRVIGHEQRLGFTGAVRRAWQMIRDESACTHVFHLEDDFAFDQDIDLRGMASTLDATPWLAQIALLRQPWSPQEHAAGGIIARHPDAYTDRRCVITGLDYLDHRQWFTTNPCLYRRDLVERTDWPDVDRSEEAYSAALFADDGARCAYLGRRGDPPRVRHIGAERVGTGY